MKKYGKWFEGNVFRMNFKPNLQEMETKFAKGVNKPLALETKKRKGKEYSRFYYKPLQPGEFWD